MVNLSQGFKDMLTLLREAGHGVYKIVSGVNQAVGQHNAEALRHISGESVTHLDVLITNPKKVEVGMDLLDFPSIVFYQIPMSTYTLRQASRRSWRIPQRKPVRVYFLTYSETMQTRLMQLMADKLMSSLAVEGELSDKGLAALSETSDSMAKELAKMLIEKSESDESQSLKDIWAAYRKKEIQVELTIREDLPQAATEPVIICTEKADAPAPEIKMASTDVEKIGDRVVKVQFIEYTGKRKKKVTHIEVREDELEEMLKDSDKPVQARSLRSFENARIAKLYALHAFISAEGGFVAGTRFEVEYAVSLGSHVQVHWENGLSERPFQYSFPFLEGK